MIRMWPSRFFSLFFNEEKENILLDYSHGTNFLPFDYQEAPKEQTILICVGFLFVLRGAFKINVMKSECFEITQKATGQVKKQSMLFSTLRMLGIYAGLEKKEETG